MDEANVAACQTMENYLNIVAPFDGIITRRNVHPGAFTGPDSQFKDPVLVLKQNDKLRLTVLLPESFIDEVDEKSDVLFSINALPGKVFKGKISRTSKSVNEQDRSMAVEIDVSKQPDIKPGMYAEVNIPLITSGLNSFIVPGSAILTTTENKYIIAVDKQMHAHFIKVHEGIANGSTTEVFGNIPDNTSILKNPSNEIKDGSLIQL